MSDTWALPKQWRGAELRAESFNADDNTIEVVWTTGARVRRFSWAEGGPVDEELEVSGSAIRLDRLNAGAPFLNTHNSYDLSAVLGAVVPGTARIEKGLGVSTIKLSTAPEDASIIQKIRDRIINNISVGYRIHKAIRIDGDDGDPPLLQVVDWEPLEISAVPIPADPGAQVRAAPETYPCVVTRADAPAADPAPHEEETMAEGQAAESRGENTNQIVTPPVAPAAAAAEEVSRAAATAAADAVKAERKRSATIQDLAARSGANYADFGAKHIADGTSVEDFRTLLLGKMHADQRATEGNQPVRGQVSVEVTGPAEEEKRAAAIENALLHRWDGAAYKLTDQGREYRGMTLIEIGKEFLRERGIKVRGLSSNQIAGMVMVRDGGGLSTSDFPNILANVANKTLRQGYDAVPQTFRPMIRQTTVPDFKPVSRTQLGEAPQLEKVNENGEFKRGKMTDAAERYSIATYGKIISISRQVIINDDLDAFTRIPRAFGLQANNLESDLVWGQITGNPNMGDGNALFSAAHNNLGAGAVITTDSVGAGRQAMRNQKGLDGVTLINVEPVYIFGPTALETTMEKFLSPIVPTRSADVVPGSMKKLVPIAEPRLDAVSTSNWYLAGSPAQIDMIELAYLEGQEGIYTETKVGFDVDGIEIKVRTDVGAKVIDWRGFWKNPN